MSDASPLRPGLLVLHGNRVETLAQAVFAWLAANPLGALEEETLLVQSNGMAEWLKMEIATAQGICAATRVELPARFVWRAYRAVLGRAAVPTLSALDKQPLTWRLMSLLPRLLQEPGYEPLAAFLRSGAGLADTRRRLQLAQRLADLYDQYQVYRSDWLQDWASGHDQLRSPAGQALPLPPDQAWQPALWRQVLAALDADALQATRPALHQRFLQALQAGASDDALGNAFADGLGDGLGDPPPRRWPQLPRRIVLFGTTQLPHQTLEAIAALADHAQVLLAVPNPCRYHWADTIAGRELLQAQRRRLPLRGGADLAAVPLQDMHAHGHPLLSAWGRQSRDFVRQLDTYDDVQATRQRHAASGTAMPRVDLFDEADPQSLLQQVQAHIRDLLPLAEHPHETVPASDGSIVFHIAHSAQREVEILHDQLLHLLAQPATERFGDAALNPRDIVVMVPNIDTFAPAIRSVFGQHARGHALHIPWGLTDQRDRGHHPLLLALEWLLHAPQPRCTFSELRQLLDVPAVARRLGLQPDDVPQLMAWAEAAGLRWGLHENHRTLLDLGACGDINTWRFGLRRMLLGYATGDLPDGHAGIEPQAEVAGLHAGLAGALDMLLQHLQTWWDEAGAVRKPAAWGLRLRALLQALFSASDDEERALLSALDEALSSWLLTCETAGFDEAVDLAVVREAWLEGVDEPGLSRRFKAGGVTFCTLLPMRAIPFQVVCLLGMNEGDYPRRSPRSDFDLMALPGQARPGDRSRRDDDRQLMLDALLSARRVLYISWAGRSARDNTEQPPSVLVSQLRDYLAAGWSQKLLQARTTEHPLQPFSRRYFEQGAERHTDPDSAAAPALFTYASEWRAAHGVETASSPAPVASGPSANTSTAAPTAWTISRLARFLRNPVAAWFEHRLQVRFDEHPAAVSDDESFVTAGLDRWQLMDEVLRAAQLQHGRDANRPLDVRPHLQRLQRAGRLPVAGPGEQVAADLLQTLQPMLSHWQALQAAHAQALDTLALRWPPGSESMPEAGVLEAVLDDTLAGLRSTGALGALPLWVDLSASRLQSGPRNKTLRSDKLLHTWLRCLAVSALGQAAEGVLIGADVVLHVQGPPSDEARATLDDLLQAAQAGIRGPQPWPTALRTGLALLTGDRKKARTAFEGGDHGGSARGEGHEPCLYRLFPNFASLSEQPGFEAASRRLYAPLQRWMERHVQVEELPGQMAPEDGDVDV